MDEQKRAGFVATAEKIKGAAMCLIGIVIAQQCHDTALLPAPLLRVRNQRPANRRWQRPEKSYAFSFPF